MMIDHLIWYTPELSMGIEDFEAMTGIRADMGGVHAGLGTHNALLSLGGRCYLEIIAPDPKQHSGAWKEKLEQAACPGLFHWAVAVSNLTDLARNSSDEFLRNKEVVCASRQSEMLGNLKWQLLMPQGHSFGALVPFLIDWGSSPHPSINAPGGCQFKNIEIYSADKARLETFFHRLGLDLKVSVAEQPCFSVTIDTPKGLLKLVSINPLPEGLTL